VRRILIFGNSASGKSTLAAKLALDSSLAHLDLDSLAWLPTETPQRRPLIQTEALIEEFLVNNDSWVIEGCYTDLLDILKDQASEIVFLNLSIAQCLQNAKSRPWEPHKYDSKEAQDANLEMLLGWIAQYDKRNDVFSLQAHTQFFEGFPGPKTCILSNEDSFI
jgi:adenylate kinase family enzyme